jgi:hypothetical protein
MPPHKEGRRVVLVAPEFPPANTAGAHRPRLFAKHLPSFGWTPTVLTLRRDQIEGPLDSDLERLIDPELEVVRTGAIPIKPLRMIGDVGIRSLAGHARALAAMARRGEVGAVVLFGPPWFSFALGPLVCRPFGIPYLVDYIDPWISDWTASHSFPSKGWFYHRAATVIEPVALKSASYVTAVSQGMLDGIRSRYRWLADDRMSAMPYGAEPDDIEASARLGIEPPDFRGGSGDVTICFTGAVQPHGRELVRAVLLAVRALRGSQSPLAPRIRLRFYGTSNLTWGHGREVVIPLARDLGVAEVVSEMAERIPYLSAMAVLRASDIVLVMGSTEQSYDASKLYPAIMSGRPVLAICHEASRMRAVMDEHAAGLTVPFSDAADLAYRADDIRRAIETLAVRPPRRPRAWEVDRFTARASTAVLAEALNRMAVRPHPAEAV